MFGKMNVVPVVDLRNTPDEVGRCSEEREEAAGCELSTPRSKDGSSR